MPETSESPPAARDDDVSSLVLFLAEYAPDWSGTLDGVLTRLMTAETDAEHRKAAMGLLAAQNAGLREERDDVTAGKCVGFLSGFTCGDDGAYCSEVCRLRAAARRMLDAGWNASLTPADAGWSELVDAAEALAALAPPKEQP